MRVMVPVLCYVILLYVFVDNVSFPLQKRCFFFISACISINIIWTRFAVQVMHQYWYRKYWKCYCVQVSVGIKLNCQSITVSLWSIINNQSATW